MRPTVLSLTPFFFSKSFRNSNMARVKWPSCGEVRKNHLKPRSVSVGDEDSPFMCGTP